MSDPATFARTARESLSKGLQTLQADPSVPAQLKALAEPIAQAMGALMQIEKSNGVQLMPHTQVAMEHSRVALTALQAQANAHPAIPRAVEAVAGSLGMIHNLGKLAGLVAAPAAQASFVNAPTQVAPPAAFAAPQPAAPPQAAPPVARDPFAAPPQHAPAPMAPGSQPRMPGATPLVTADLGAQSATNFYKGLSGNDIVDHGGLFVSTYMVPKIGSPVRLKVSLPGGYEFEAEAVVRWSREQRNESSDSPPGFGAQFTNITQEARQLIYRYVRNREPLFHDDF